MPGPCDLYPHHLPPSLHRTPGYTRPRRSTHSSLPAYPIAPSRNAAAAYAEVTTITSTPHFSRLRITHLPTTPRENNLSLPAPNRPADFTAHRRSPTSRLPISAITAQCTTGSATNHRTDRTSISKDPTQRLVRPTFLPVPRRSTSYYFLGRSRTVPRSLTEHPCLPAGLNRTHAFLRISVLFWPLHRKPCPSRGADCCRNEFSS